MIGQEHTAQLRYGFNNPIPFTGGNPLSSFNTLWFRYAMFF
ncbi:MAG: hypothetical protein ACXVBO_17240 [Isosphaeraceae bacterium]